MKKLSIVFLGLIALLFLPTGFAKTHQSDCLAGGSYDPKTICVSGMLDPYDNGFSITFTYSCVPGTMLPIYDPSGIGEDIGSMICDNAPHKTNSVDGSAVSVATDGSVDIKGLTILGIIADGLTLPIKGTSAGIYIPDTTKHRFLKCKQTSNNCPGGDAPCVACDD